MYHLAPIVHMEMVCFLCAVADAAASALVAAAAVHMMMRTTIYNSSISDMKYSNTVYSMSYMLSGTDCAYKCCYFKALWPTQPLLPSPQPPLCL